MPPRRPIRALHSSPYQRFVKRLILARQRAGLTQVEAAAALGRPQSYVSKCEAGQRRVDVIELQAFARLYRVALEFFVR